MSLFPQAGPRHRRAGLLHVRPAVLGVVCGLVLGLGCAEIQGPFPVPLAPNLQITPTPARDALVDAAAIERVELAFDQPMDRGSVQQVTRISFLLPVAVRDLDGIWNADDSAVAFEFGSFPTPQGALYEARFTGLRTAAGVLYNGGPFELRFETLGTPDLFPLRPHARVATRNYCRRTGSSTAACLTTTMHADSIGTDSLRVHSTCEDCIEARDDFYHGRAGRIEWLGWDDTDFDDAVLRRVRWTQPPALVATGTRLGDVLGGMPQISPSGVTLLRWRSTNRGTASPTQPVRAGAGTLEVVYSRSTMIDLDYALRIDGVEESRVERWWLLPGVGLVRRETRVQRDGGPVQTTFESFIPSLTNVSVN